MLQLADLMFLMAWLGLDDLRVLRQVEVNLRCPCI